jgi:plastocyanin
MSRIKGWLVISLVACAALICAAPSGWADDEEVTTFEIRAKDLNWWYEEISLNNNIIALPVGVTVLYTNVDPLITSAGLEGVMPHGVKISDQEGTLTAHSGLLFQEKTTFTHKFTVPGTYDFQCIVHPFMKGKFMVFDVMSAKMTQAQNAVNE